MHFQKTLLYLSGPMSNIPQFNIPLFDAVSAALRADGYGIINPAEEDGEEVRAAALANPDGKYDADGKLSGDSWGDMLARDVKLLADGVPGLETDDAFKARMREAVKHWQEEEREGPMPPLVRIPDATRVPIDGIALLPGWENSRGARLEAFVGLLTGKEFYCVLHHQDRAGIDNTGFVDTYSLQEVSAEWVQHMLALKWADAIKMHAPLPYAYTIP